LAINRFGIGRMAVGVDHDHAVLHRAHLLPGRAGLYSMRRHHTESRERALCSRSTRTSPSIEKIIIRDQSTWAAGKRYEISWVARPVPDTPMYKRNSRGR